MNIPPRSLVHCGRPETSPAEGLTHAARRAVALVVAIAGLLPAHAARAESGRFNLHIEPGLSTPLVVRSTTPREFRPLETLGGFGWLGFDWQFAQPLALEVIAGVGIFPLAGHAGLGVRWRPLDNFEGYANEDRGDHDGNLWMSAHLGVLAYANVGAALDIGVGYEFSELRPLQIGLFARGVLGVGEAIDVAAVAGLSFSFAFNELRPLDTDGDWLPDEREIVLHHTNPRNPDTDADSLADGLEVRTETNPLLPDSDGDQLPDGMEDANRNGEVDGDETDPRRADTDSGGAPDGWERGNPPHNPLNPADDDSDHDGVSDDRDACPDTPRGIEVDERGCAILRERLVLDGVRFAFDSADLLPESEDSLKKALTLLRDNADARVEIGGHTDNVGTEAHNRRLSGARAASVKNWLVEHGIDRRRITTRGYASSRPVAPNDSEENRALNRRIEFTHLNAGEAVRRQP
jgi:outer membrane protein OmpA-like peptidoglycan-associated protein